jgi:hypothetical protein
MHLFPYYRENIINNSVLKYSTDDLLITKKCIILKEQNIIDNSFAPFSSLRSDLLAGTTKPRRQGDKEACLIDPNE